MPQISDRTTWSQWHERGEKSAEARAQEIAKKILDSHKPPALTADVEKTVWDIVREADKKASQS